MLTVYTNIYTKNVTKRLNQSNCLVLKWVKCTEILTIVGLLISFKINLLATAYRNDCLTLTFNCLFLIQSILSISMNSPIKKLLVLIKQSNSGYLILVITNFKRAKINAIKLRRVSLQKYICFRHLFPKKITISIKKIDLRKNCYDWRKTT